MTNYVADKVVVVSGAGGGFGKLVCEMTAAMGAKVVGCDVNESALREVFDGIAATGADGTFRVTDVRDRDEMHALAQFAIERFGRIDVMINNAGTMPLAFYSDHATAAVAWDTCIDINFKGVLNGINAVYDQMMAQGCGHVINISSIYGNFPNAGSAVYSATKAAVNVLSEALRVESQGTIKVTVVKPTGVPSTGLGGSVVNPEAIIGILGANAATFGDNFMAYLAGPTNNPLADENSTKLWSISPEHLAQNIVYTINQPWGVSISDITVRATGEQYLL